MQAWRAVAELLADGFSALPRYSSVAMLVAAAASVALTTLKLWAKHRRPAWLTYLPSGTAVGIAFIVFPSQSTVMAVGAGVSALWAARDPHGSQKLLFSVASGLIAGGGLMGVVNALLSLGNVSRWQ